jgi:hypothetical protein
MSACRERGVGGGGRESLGGRRQGWGESKVRIVVDDE